MPGFQSLFRFCNLHYFVLAKLATTSARVNFQLPILALYSFPPWLKLKVAYGGNNPDLFSFTVVVYLTLQVTLKG